MANRQHGGRGPSVSGSPAARRAGRTVPVSRSSAAGRGPVNRRAPAAGQQIWTPFPPGAPVYKEPEVRRWPHPLEDGSLPPASAPEPALHYIRCALSYQNQLLADIKVLLEQMAPAAAPEAGPEEPGEDPPKL